MHLKWEKPETRSGVTTTSSSDSSRFHQVVEEVAEVSTEAPQDDRLRETFEAFGSVENRTQGEHPSRPAAWWVVNERIKSRDGKSNPVVADGFRSESPLTKSHSGKRHNLVKPHSTGERV